MSYVILLCLLGVWSLEQKTLTERDIKRGREEGPGEKIREKTRETQGNAKRRPRHRETKEKAGNECK